ncbi:hypothetical protein A8B84_11815 [Marinobacter sp. EhC06]|jgi:hypothetical protein|uniref:hypothetical protein n=1 Tax=Marinobacter TaxID=2742 RepID=UPI0007DA2F0B|nr:MULTISPECIES: hypothetical protein [unclassified Marinobacter]OAN89886.1 hypothetical protein A8B84_11815 [Marinobacter sp. EhC06]OAN93932.1 hypothetical protein A8B80_15835 [Marinobacter sp. EhN04]
MKIIVIPKAIIVLAAFIYTGWFAANAIGYLFGGGIEGGVAFIHQRMGESNWWGVELLLLLICMVWSLKQFPGRYEDDEEWRLHMSGARYSSTAGSQSAALNDEDFDEINAVASQSAALGIGHGDMDSGTEVNPANGLPMVGAVDIEGNPYGTDDLHHDVHCDGLDTGEGCFDTFDNSAMDDFSGGFSDDSLV